MEPIVFSTILLEQQTVAVGAVSVPSDDLARITHRFYKTLASLVENPSSLDLV
jgi:hypothetical protein